MYMNQPPKYVPKRKKSVLPGIVLACVCLALGFGGGYAGTKLANATSTSTTQSSSVSINQISGSGSGTTVYDVSDIVETIKPTVVEITTETITSGNSMFGQYVSEGAGSGVIMSSDGYIITNNHVVEDANSIKVTTSDGTEYTASLVGKDSQSDLAVIKIEASDLPVATFGDSDALSVGDSAIAIGNPLGSLGGTVTTGIISALDRQITIDGETMTLLQTDAAINPGNSGGGLFDASGNLIGIVNAKQSATGIEGLGFAIPINGAVDIINDLIANGVVTTRAALNASLQNLTSNPFSNSSSGCYIVQIIEGGAADQAGLQAGDQIIEFDGQSITSTSEVKSILKNLKAGDVVSIKVLRDGNTEEFEITLGSSSANN
jgi:serine protease Do